MADAKPTISQAKNVGDWVKAYLDDDANEMSKRDKFLHLQRVTQFGAFCYMIQNNSKQAHIDFFDSNYTHMDTDVAKAAEMVSRLLEIMYTNYPIALSNSDVDAVNNVVGLFGGGRQPLTDVIREDYIKLAKSFSEHIPQYPNPSDTANMMKALNKDMVDVQSDHTRLVHATGTEKGSLKRDEIYTIMDTATEKLAGIWKEAKDEKSSAEKALMKDSEDAVGKRIDLGIKTAKVGILGAGAVGCIGAVVGGLFWPALGLIPIFVLGKRWLPDFAKSIGGLYGNFKKRVADRYKIKKAQIKQDYIEKGPNALTKAQLMMLSPGDRIILDKQRKSFPYLYGKDSLREMTMDYLNLGKLESPTEIENMVPADVRDMLNGKINAFGATTTYNDLMQTANMIKSFESKLPEMDKLPIKQKYAEKAAEVIERLVFSEKIDALNSFQTTDKSSLLGEDSEIRKLIATDPNLERKVRNFYAFADKEHIGMTNPNQSLEDFVRNYPTASSVNVASLTLSPGAATEAHTKLAVKMVDGLTRDWGTSSSTYKNAEYTATVSGTTYTLKDIRDEISQIPNNDDKKVIEKALADQMKHLFEEDKKDYTIKAMEILRHEGTDGAKNDFVDLLKEIGELKFEDLAGGKAGELYQKILKTNPKTPAKPMDLYLLTRLRLAMQELCFGKMESLRSGTPEIKDIKDFMLTINNSSYVDEYHKQAIMSSVVVLFRTYIKNNEYAFKTNLAKTSEFLQALSELTMLTDTQRDEILDLVAEHLDSAINENVNQLKFEFAESYDYNAYNVLIENYSTKGGLKDLFERSTNPAVLNAKGRLDYLRGLGSVKTGLNVGESMTGQKKNWNKEELDFVTARFFAKETRASNDGGLRQFIEGKVKNIVYDYTDPASDKIDAATIKKSKGFDGLKKALDFVNSMPYSNDDEIQDQFAAYILLKNKCVAMFRDCMKKLVSKGVLAGTHNADTWITNHQTEINDMIAEWGALMAEIDNQMADTRFNAKLQAKSKFTAVKELTKFRGAASADFVQAYQESELGG
ncbi:MAG: hypothetical protein IJ310_01745 [Clostridia bacterium]|nr:hypothetical protein [Clostridia bacterium]